MGQQGISRQKMVDFQKETGNKLTKADIQKYYKFWHELFPNGLMDKNGFKKFSKIAMPNAPPDADVEYLFRAMDRDKNGTIDFKEFLLFQSITAPTTMPLQPDELIELAFDMYDEDNDGYVTSQEMRESLTNMFKAKGLDVSSEEVQKTIRIRIDNLLKVADANGDNMLTKEEILKACRKDPSLLVMF